MTRYGVSHRTNGRFIKAYSSEGPMRELQMSAIPPLRECVNLAVQVGPIEQAGNYQVHLEAGVDLYNSSRPVLSWFLTGLFVYQPF